jgi:hypothetical protein
MPFKKMLLNIAVATSAICGASQAVAFDIYGFIPYGSRVDGGQVISGRASKDWFSALGIRPIDVVYERRVLDYPDGEKSRKLATINADKIRDLANSADRKRNVPVSLDLEGWDRSAPGTPGLLLQTLKEFRATNPDAMVGFYATVPQNTYGWREDKQKSYDDLNSKYAVLAEAVDYFSPSLYNYSKGDFAAWEKSARYNISAARKYSSTKKVLPYITPEVSENGATRWLSYDEMMSRLEALKSLGADGCIVWTSSQTRDASGNAPVLDPSTGWLKAVSDFGKKNS